MKLDRNINPTGRGKYALVKLRQLDAITATGDYSAVHNVECLQMQGVLDYGDTPKTEFFVIRLKDKYAHAALNAYAQDAAKDDKEYAEEILELARKAREMKSRKPD